MVRHCVKKNPLTIKISRSWAKWSGRSFSCTSSSDMPLNLSLLFLPSTGASVFIFFSGDFFSESGELPLKIQEEKNSEISIQQDWKMKRIFKNMIMHNNNINKEHLYSAFPHMCWKVNWQRLSRSRQGWSKVVSFHHSYFY